MSSEQKESKRKDLTPIATSIVGSVTGTLFGLAVGGPVGAVAGAAAGPLATFATQALAKRLMKAESVLESGAAAAGETKEEFVRGIATDEHKLEAASAVLNAAANSHYSEKLASLAALLAEIRHEQPDRLEKYFIIIPILDFIEPPHVEVLRFISRYNEEQPSLIGCEPETIMAHYPDYELIIRSIVRMLELHGLITDVGSKDPLIYKGKVYWRIAPIGAALLEILNNQTALIKTESKRT